eukprot:GHVT01062573.1.p5 GENE.GHVT01062573.1~~GHVT01062573.1.p5  ORF type:complete len:128 (+),score=17.75 GHVT01062573.1:4253-4636(+)
MFFSLACASLFLFLLVFLRVQLLMQSICASLQRQGHPVEVSSDAGNFVCNYAYYLSLLYSATSTGVCSLFVHIPPFSAIPQAQQEVFLMDLLKSLHTFPQSGAASDSRHAQPQRTAAQPCDNTRADM